MSELCFVVVKSKALPLQIFICVLESVDWIGVRLKEPFVSPVILLLVVDLILRQCTIIALQKKLLLILVLLLNLLCDLFSSAHTFTESLANFT